jgi:hypothetical protein
MLLPAWSTESSTTETLEKPLDTHPSLGGVRFGIDPSEIGSWGSQLRHDRNEANLRSIVPRLGARVGTEAADVGLSSFTGPRGIALIPHGSNAEAFPLRPAGGRYGLWSRSSVIVELS